MFRSLKWHDFKIGMKYAIAFIITITLFLLSTGIIYILIQTSKNDFNVIEKTSDNTLNITSIISALNEQDVIITDFILFQTPSLKDDFGQNSDKMQAQLDSLKPDIAAAQETIEYVKKNMQQMQTVFFEEIIPAVERRDQPRYILARRKSIECSAICKEALYGIQEVLGKSRETAMENSRERLDNTIIIQLLSIALAVILGLAVMYAVSNNVNRRLNAVVLLSNEIAKGNLNIDNADYQGNDEIGQIARAFNKMADNLRHIIGQIINASTDVNHKSTDLRDSAVQLKQGIEQVAITMEQLANAAGEQAELTVDAVSLVEGLNNQVTIANEQSEYLDKAAQDLRSMAGRGYSLMDNSIEQMKAIHDAVRDSARQVKELEEKTQRISQLVEIIQDISEQTNLLALNAAIEAARAGEAGRGFAVVADEIRKLAEQVGNSVKEITDIIKGIQDQSLKVAGVLRSGYEQVEQGTNQIKVTGETFRDINNEVASIAEIINSVGNGIEIIAGNSEKINASIEHIASITQETAAGIQQTSTSVQQQNSSLEVIKDNARTLSELARDLDDLVSRFSL